MLTYSDLAFHSPKLRARMIPGWDLDYFNSEEWLDVQDWLDKCDREATHYTPNRLALFRSLSICSLSDCRVLFCGQDPYPNGSHATGVAFSMCTTVGPQHYLDTGHGGETTEAEHRVSRMPPTLHVIFKELVNDLKLEWPKTGCLESWCKQGVLLWNACPIYLEASEAYKNDLRALLKPLTQEIVERLSAKGQVVFVFCGRKAQEFYDYVDHFNNISIFVSHPSPRGQLSAKSKFIGSRVFSRINDHLNHFGKEPIDWTL